MKKRKTRNKNICANSEERSHASAVAVCCIVEDARNPTGESQHLDAGVHSLGSDPEGGASASPAAGGPVVNFLLFAVLVVICGFKNTDKSLVKFVPKQKYGILTYPTQVSCRTPFFPQDF